MAGLVYGRSYHIYSLDKMAIVWFFGGLTGVWIVGL